MKRKWVHLVCFQFLFLFFGFVFLVVFGAEISVQTAVPMVVGFPEDEVIVQELEKELVQLFSEQPQWEWNEQQYQFLRQKKKEEKQILQWGKVEIQEREENAKFTVIPLSQKWGKFFLSLKEKWIVDLVLLVRLEKEKEQGNYQAYFSLVHPKSHLVFYSEKRELGTMEEFSFFPAIVQEVFFTLLDRLPWQANCLRRAGENLVFSAGGKKIHEGGEYGVYSLSIDSNRKTEIPWRFEKTATVTVTRVEPHFVFAKIFSEKKKEEKCEGKILRLQEEDEVEEIKEEYTKGNHLVQTGTVYPNTKGKYGILEANILMGLVGYQSNFTETEQSRQAFFPGASLQGEIWLTRHWIFSASLSFITASFYRGVNLGDGSGEQSQNVSANVNRIAFLGGYRFRLHSFLPYAASQSTEFLFQFGYEKDSFHLEPRSDSFGFFATNYQGFRIGGMVHLPIWERFGLGFGVATLLFPSVRIAHSQIGRVHSGEMWEFSLRSFWSLSLDLNLEFSFSLQEFRSEQEKIDVNRVTLFSTSHSTKIFRVGLVKYL